MTSRVDASEYDFENRLYSPEISLLDSNINVDCAHMEQSIQHNPLRAVPVAHASDDVKHVTYVVDSVIKVRVISDAVREEKAKYWQQKLSKSNIFLWSSGIIGSFAMGGAALFYSSDNYYWVGYLVSSLALFVISKIYYDKSSHAQHQIEGWKASPLEKILELRQLAYRDGFPFVYKNNLKRMMLSQEVLFLYKRYFSQFCQKFLREEPDSQKSRKEWLDRFTTMNPLSHGALLYAHGEIPALYTEVCRNYEELQDQLIHIREHCNALREQRREESQAVIRVIERNRTLAMVPFQAMLSYGQHQAKTAYEAELQAAGISENDKKRAKEKHDNVLAKYSIYYTAAIVPVNIYYNKQVDDAKAELQGILATVDRQENSSQALFFDHARQLLAFARQLSEKPPLVYSSLSLPLSQSINVPLPSAPPVVNINFVQQASQQPSNIQGSDYNEYLKFLSWQQQNAQPAY